MAPPRPRLIVLAVLLLAALGALIWSWSARHGGEVQMVDAPCPMRAPSEEARPVRHDWVELCRYQPANARLLASGQPVRAVLLGDSISEWWGRADPQLFRAGLVNRGITGQTSQQLVLRFRQDVLALRPKIVVIQAGLNDVIGLAGLIGPDAYIDNIETMIDLAEAQGIVPVLTSLPAATAFPDREAIALPPRVADLNRRLRALAVRRGAVYADFHAALAGPDGSPRPGLSSDGVHLTPAGYAALRPVLEAALAAAETRGPSRSRPQ